MIVTSNGLSAVGGCLVAQEWLLGCWSWSAVGAGYCIVISWYQTGRCSEETRGDFRRLFEVSSWKSCLNGRLSEVRMREVMIGLVGCAGSAAVIGWIPCLLLQLVLRTETPCLEIWFGGEDPDPMLLGQEEILPLFWA